MDGERAPAGRAEKPLPFVHARRTPGSNEEKRQRDEEGDPRRIEGDPAVGTAVPGRGENRLPAPASPGRKRLRRSGLLPRTGGQQEPVRRGVMDISVNPAAVMQHGADGFAEDDAARFGGDGADETHETTRS